MSPSLTAAKSRATAIDRRPRSAPAFSASKASASCSSTVLASASVSSRRPSTASTLSSDFSLIDSKCRRASAMRELHCSGSFRSSGPSRLTGSPSSGCAVQVSRMFFRQRLNSRTLSTAARLAFAVSSPRSRFTTRSDRRPRSSNGLSPVSAATAVAKVVRSSKRMCAAMPGIKVPTCIARSVNSSSSRPSTAMPILPRRPTVRRRWTTCTSPGSVSRNVSRAHVSTFARSPRLSSSAADGMGTAGGSTSAGSFPPSATERLPIQYTAIGSWISSGMCCDRSARPVRHQTITFCSAVLPAPLKPPINVTSQSKSNAKTSGSSPSAPQCRCRPAKRCASTRISRHIFLAATRDGLVTARSGRGASSACSNPSISSPRTGLTRGHRCRFRA